MVVVGTRHFHVSDVDALYKRALKAGHQPPTAPHDAEWGEHYFYLTDPDGHELSFARPIRRKRARSSASIQASHRTASGRVTTAPSGFACALS